MQKIIDYKGIEEIIQFIEQQYKVLDDTKTQLQDYLNNTKNGNFDLNEQGSAEEKIKKIETLYDKFDEIVQRRTNISITTETLKNNTEKILNKTKDILKFSGKEEDINKIHDEMIDKMIEYEKRYVIRRLMN